MTHVHFPVHSSRWPCPDLCQRESCGFRQKGQVDCPRDSCFHIPWHVLPRHAGWLCCRGLHFSMALPGPSFIHPVGLVQVGPPYGSAPGDVAPDVDACQPYFARGDGLADHRAVCLWSSP